MTLDNAKAEIVEHCEQILKCFKPGAEVTVVVVNDRYGDAGCVVSSGSIARAGEEMQRRLNEQAGGPLR